MTSYIHEFDSKKKPSDYYHKLMDEIKNYNKEYHAFLNLNENENGAMGFPFSAKSNICVKDFETTAGSKMLKGYLPPFNATVIERMLNNKDFHFVGNTNMDEFGFGTFGLNCEVPARNAYNMEYTAGGSSSGAAVATALIKYHVAIAESTGGSIAAPAAFNGVVGFTPTYGAVSRYGLIDYANSLDKIGVMGRSSEDIKIVFDRIKGRDEYDTTCSIERMTDVKKKKLFVVKNMVDGIAEEIKQPFEKLLQKLEAMGHDIEYITSDVLGKAIEPYYIVAMAEASTNLAKYTGFKYGLQHNEYGESYNEFFTESRANFGSEAKRRIILGTFIRSASLRDKYYTKALVIRRIIIKEMSKLLDDGFVISPTMPILTPRISKVSELTPVENYMMDIFTIPPNFGGFPHISFPYDYVDGMPLGAQVVTAQANDYALLDFVTEWEKSFEYKFKHNLGEL